MRFFLNPSDIDKANGTARVWGQDAAHIKNALRLKKGDIITVCDGAGLDYACEIAAFDKDAAELKIINTYNSSTEPEIKVSLFQAVPKYGKMELIIEKCVELGVFEIYPVITRYTQGARGAIKDGKAKRYANIAEAAAKQCNRAFIPRVYESVAFDEAVSIMKQRDIAIAAWEREEKAKMRDCLKGFTGDTAALLVGPEGGFSEDEAAAFKRHDIKTVNLGRRILRTETAGFTCLTIFFNETGEF